MEGFMFKVNKDKCIGCGACTYTCGEVFDFDDSGLATVKAQPNEKNLELATEALENCPVGAIEKE